MPYSRILYILSLSLLIGCSNSTNVKETEVGEKVPDSLFSISIGKEMFYNYCTNCHFIINKPEEIDTPMSTMSLYDMYKEKVTIKQLQTALADDKYHSTVKHLVNSDSLNDVKAYLWNRFNPSY